MPNPNYQRGLRFENKCLAWLVHLGSGDRSFMSRGADLKILRGLRYWTFSCKKFKRENIPSLSKLLKELETHDFVTFGMDREVPYFLGPLPKVVEFAKEESICLTQPRTDQVASR